MKHNLTFSSDVITRFIEFMSNGLGTLYNPKSLKNEVAHAIDNIEFGTGAGLEFDIFERTIERLLNKEIRHQKNIEDIGEKSIKYLEENKLIDKTKIEPEWETSFFQKVQDISTTHIQEIWAKILAKEISQPGSISYRTLEVLSKIPHHEIILFKIACSFVSMNKIIWKLNNKKGFEKFGITNEQLLLMRESGLFHQNDNLTFKLNTHKFSNSEKWGILRIGNKSFKILNLKDTTQKTLQFNQIALTNAGRELCSLINAESNPRYINQVVTDKEKSGYSLILIK